LSTVIIDGVKLCLSQFINVCRNYSTVILNQNAICNINKSQQVFETILQNNKTHYGITTGFGYQHMNNVKKEEQKRLQENLIMSHAVGIGEPFDEEIVRGMMLLLVNSLSKGFSGVRLKLVETLINMLNKKVHPIVPRKGSLGASGDLVPLAHLMLPVIGLGQARYNGDNMSGLEAMQSAQISVLRLDEKEGLACINGTHCMTSIGAFLVYDTKNILKIADIAAALSFEALIGIPKIFDERIHKIRPHKGQIDTAKIMKSLLQNSKLVYCKAIPEKQDAYSLRCIPQVHGASKDAYNHVLENILIEINSVTDNPIIFVDENEIASTGNFHGQPLALCYDFLCIALSEIANISERRIERLVNPQLNKGLPAFLIKKNDINSGFMIMQYAAAALVSENKVLSHPASVDSIPTSANQEDHVSMGTIAANKTKDILLNVRKVLAMELLCSCQGIDLRKGMSLLGKGTAATYKVIRGNVNYMETDRELYKDLYICEKLIKDEEIIINVEEVINEIIF